MLVEIRTDLQAIDPLLERIDDRNRRYSRISTERIRSQIHADSGLAAKITSIAQAWADEDYPLNAAPDQLIHSLHRLRYLSTGSLYTRRNRSVAKEGCAEPMRRR
jgi:hypothetical protein